MCSFHGKSTIIDIFRYVIEICLEACLHLKNYCARMCFHFFLQKTRITLFYFSHILFYYILSLRYGANWIVLKSLNWKLLSLCGWMFWSLSEAPNTIPNEIAEQKFVKMSSEIEDHITKKYEIKKRLGKGVSLVQFCFESNPFISPKRPHLLSKSQLDTPWKMSDHILIIMIIIVVFIMFLRSGDWSRNRPRGHDMHRTAGSEH